MNEPTAPSLDDDEGIDSFPEDIRKDVEGLLWLGHLEEEVEYCGHSFVLRTLKADEELLAAILAKEYMDTMGQAKAWAWANVSQAIVSVDGDENWCPAAGPSKKEHGRQKYNFCIGNWYWHVGEFLFGAYLELASRQLRAVDRVRDLQSRSLQPSTPSVSSSTEQGDSENHPEILDHLKED